MNAKWEALEKWVAGGMLMTGLFVSIIGLVEAAVLVVVTGTALLIIGWTALIAANLSEQLERIERHVLPKELGECPQHPPR